MGEDDMTLLTDLETEALERDDTNGWSREMVEEIPEQGNPELLKPFKHAFMASYSLTIRDNRTRKVIGSPVTNGELSRLYLRRTMATALEAGGSPFLAKKVPWRSAALQFMDRTTAISFDGQTGGPFELVDVKACYATLYSRMTIDMTYRPETDPPLLGLGKGEWPRLGEWMSAKGARNALWGSVMNRRVNEWCHGDKKEDAFPNAFFAPDLRGIVLDASHAIATEAIEQFHALSWFADGGIFRPGEGRAFAAWLEETWGLVSVVKAEGPGWLFGPTSYSIGPLATLDVQNGRAIQGTVGDNVRRQSRWHRSWLADVFKERET
jgi:hypothetical protein